MLIRPQHINYLVYELVIQKAIQRVDFPLYFCVSLYGEMACEGTFFYQTKCPAWEVDTKRHILFYFSPIMSSYISSFFFQQ